MLSKHFTGLFLAAAVAFTPVAAVSQAQDKAPAGVVELRQEAGRAYYAKDYRGFRNALIRLRELRPNNSEYMYQLVLAHALLDEKSAAFNTMLLMQRQGLSYDFDQTPDSANLRETELYQYLNDLMKLAGQPFGAVSEVATLGDDVVLPEAITWDPGREVFLVGTVAGGMILAVGKDGSSKELLRSDNGNGMWGVYDLQVDTARNRLWVTSAATEAFTAFSPVDTGRSAIFEYTLDTLEMVKRYPVPVDGRPHSLGNMVLAPNGDIFVADGRLPLVYVKRAEEARLKPFFGANVMVSLRGMTLSADGKALYVADYEMGITRIDLENGTAAALQLPENLNPGGTDGINFWNGYLVIIQNGTSPQRVMRLRLDVTGTQVTEVAPLAVAQEVFDFPNYGTVVGDTLYFFANSHWGSTPETFKPVKIVSTNLAEAENLMPPDMQKFLDEQKQKDQESAEPAAEAGSEEDAGSGP